MGLNADSIRYNGKIAVITGAGRDLGRICAIELARRGAKVIINDHDKDSADSTAREIIDAGGIALANSDTISTIKGGRNIIRIALDAFGGIDILIIVAPIAVKRDFIKIQPKLWDNVQDTHLNAAYNVGRDAFIAMREKRYGRIVFTVSVEGILGHPGYTSYGAATAGLIGLMNTLKLEGAKYNISTNAVADIVPDSKKQYMPEYTASLVLYLSSEQCPGSGGIYQAEGAFYKRIGLVSSAGIWIDQPKESATPEKIISRWKEIISMEGAKEYPDATAAGVNTLSSVPSDDKP